MHTLRTLSIGAAASLIALFTSACESLTGIDAATWAAAASQSSQMLAANTAAYGGYAPAYSGSQPPPFYHSAGTGYSEEPSTDSREDDETGSEYTSDSDTSSDEDYESTDWTEGSPHDFSEEHESDNLAYNSPSDNGREEDPESAEPGARDSEPATETEAEPDPSTALVVTYQNRHGYWRAAGPVQFIQVGDYETEDSVRESVYTDGPGSLEFLGTQTSTYTGPSETGSVTIRVYSLSRPLRPYEIDVRQSFSGLPD